MAKKDDIGYVYIFTNESFRDGWIKIGKTKKIEKRLNDLDNTSCPLPFDVYATLKTRRYEDAETFVHEFISHFNRDLRVRPNREYFKVQPKEALEILFQVKKLMNEPGAKITVFNEKDEKFVKQLEKKYAAYSETEEDDEEEIESTPEPQSSSPAVSVEPRTWLICYDKAYFNVEACFKKYGQIYWSHKSGTQNIKKGDTVYLYSASPESAIRFKVKVVESQLPYSSEMDAGDEFAKQGSDYSEGKDHHYFLVRCVAETKSAALKHTVMHTLGLMGKRPSTMLLSKSKYHTLKEYIEQNFDERNTTQVTSKPTVPKKDKTKKQKPQKRRPPYKHYMAGLTGGEELTFIPTGAKVKAFGENLIEYDGTTSSLNDYCIKFMPDNMRIPAGTYQGPKYFSYQGKTLWKLRLEIEK